MLLILCCLLLNVIDGLPLAKLHDTSMSFGGISLAQMHNSDLMSQIMSSKDDEEVLLSVLSDADPAQLNEVITLLKGLLATSRAELTALTTSSGNADTAFNDAVAAHNAAVVAKTNGEPALQTTKENAISDANTAYNQGVAALQAAVNAAKDEVDSTNSTKITANALLAADQTRLNTEINTLITVIALMEGVLGINTVSPTSSPTTTAPTSSPTTAGSAIDDYEYVGRGNCVEGDDRLRGKHFNRVRFYPIASAFPNLCAEKCAQFLGNEFYVGFALSISGECDCHMKGSADPSQFRDQGFYYITGYDANGLIGTSTGGDRGYCYRLPAASYVTLGAGHCVDSLNRRVGFCWIAGHTKDDCESYCTAQSNCAAYEYGQPGSHWYLDGIVCFLDYVTQPESCSQGFTLGVEKEGGNEVFKTYHAGNGGTCYKKTS